LTLIWENTDEKKEGNTNYISVVDAMHFLI